MYSMQCLGFGEFFRQQIEESTQLMPARVLGVERGAYFVHGEFGEKQASVSGRFEFTAIDGSDFPTVGDWVLVREGGMVIERIMNRRSVMARKAVGGASIAQLIAANIDFVFIVQSCNRDFSPRRLERYLLACQDEAIRPVLILNKSDLLEDRNEIVSALATFEDKLPYHFVSCLAGEGLDSVRSYLVEGSTSVLVGSSGVGKSTLINLLCNEVKQVVQEIRDEDEKGRHTTTSRKVFVAATGGLIIDTPGMREFGVTGGDVAESGLFDDIEEFAANCRYRNCQHIDEPECAVLAAIEAGDLDSARLASLRKLEKEEAFEKRKSSARESSNAKQRWKSINKQMRNHYKKRRYSE